MACKTCTQGAEYFSWFLSPESGLQQKAHPFYHYFPIGVRVLAAPVAMTVGIIKTFLFPFWTVIGAVALPIIAFMRYVQGADDVQGWLGAWCFSLASVVAVAAFVVLMVNHLTLFHTAIVLMAAIVTSISVHVNRAMRTPEPTL